MEALRLAWGSAHIAAECSGFGLRAKLRRVAQHVLCVMQSPRPDGCAPSEAFVTWGSTLRTIRIEGRLTPEKALAAFADALAEDDASASTRAGYVQDVRGSVARDITRLARVDPLRRLRGNRARRLSWAAR